MNVQSKKPIRILVALFGGLTMLGCDPNGYPHLGENFDVSAACSASSTSWIRQSLDPSAGETEEDQLFTEVLILGHGMTDDDPATVGCMYLVGLTRPGSALMDQGLFQFDGSGMTKGTWTVDYGYDFTRQPGTSLLERNGSFRIEVLPPEQRSIELIRRDDQLVLTVNGESKTFESLTAIAESLDVRDPNELRYFVRLLNVGLLTSQIRVLGFGGPGMRSYTEPANFAGLVSGEAGRLFVGVDVSIGNVNATLDYQEFSDIPGMTLSGPQLVNTNWQGDGNMGGTQSVSFASDLSSPPFFTAEADYSDTVIESGFGSTGVVYLDAEGITYEVPVEEALIVDFRGLFPMNQ